MPGSASSAVLLGAAAFFPIGAQAGCGAGYSFTGWSTQSGTTCEPPPGARRRDGYIDSSGVSRGWYSYWLYQNEMGRRRTAPNAWLTKGKTNCINDPRCRLLMQISSNNWKPCDSDLPFSNGGLNGGYSGSYYADTLWIPQCTACEPGYYLSTNASYDYDMSTNQDEVITITPGLTSCTPCAAGKYSTNSAASNCLMCTPNTRSASGALASCEPCPSGFPTVVLRIAQHQCRPLRIPTSDTLAFSPPPRSPAGRQSVSNLW